MIGTPRYQEMGTLLVLATLWALLLACPGQAIAQGSASASPGASQYEESSSPAMDVADIPPTVSDNVDDGTGSVNEAMTDRGASPAAASPAAVAALSVGALLVGCSLLLLRSSLRAS